MIYCCRILVSDYCHSFFSSSHPYIGIDLDNDKPIGFPPAHIADISFSPCDWLLLIGLESGEIRLAMDVKSRLSMIHSAFMDIYI